MFGPPSLITLEASACSKFGNSFNIDSRKLQLKGVLVAFTDREGELYPLIADKIENLPMTLHEKIKNPFEIELFMDRYHIPVLSVAFY